MPAEQLEQSPIGVAEEQLPLRSDSEAGRGDARFAHALRAEPKNTTVALTPASRNERSGARYSDTMRIGRPSSESMNCGS